MCCFDLSFGLCFDVGINRKGDVIGLINRRGLRFWLGRGLSIFQFQSVYPIQDSVQLALHSLIRANFWGTAADKIKSSVETLFGCVQMASLIVILSGVIFPLY